MLVDVPSGTNCTILMKYTGNGTGSISTVNLICVSGGYFDLRNLHFLRKTDGYIIFDRLYFFWGCHFWFDLNGLEMMVDVCSGTNVTILVRSIWIKIDRTDVIKLGRWNKKLWA